MRNKPDGHNRTELLCEKSRFADKAAWEELDGENCSSLHSGRPRFAEKCVWEKPDGDNQPQLLLEQAQSACQCDPRKRSGSNWGELLKFQSVFAEMCPWKKDGKDWTYLFSPLFRGRMGPVLPCRPQFADKCDCTKLSDRNWADILRSHPQFKAKRTRPGVDRDREEGDCHADGDGVERKGGPENPHPSIMVSSMTGVR